MIDVGSRVWRFVESWFREYSFIVDNNLCSVSNVVVNNIGCDFMVDDEIDYKIKYVLIC